MALQNAVEPNLTRLGPPIPLSGRENTNLHDSGVILRGRAKMGYSLLQKAFKLNNSTPVHGSQKKRLNLETQFLRSGVPHTLAH